MIRSRQLARDLAERAASDAAAAREWRREVARGAADEAEHRRILDECRPLPIGGPRALAAGDEPARIAEDGAAFAAQRDWDRTLEA